ncbi:phosphatidate cytidylyltransferase [Nocardiopsis sp. CC223A]|uniref:phosphatidate cytidylyltransferase n=1 Tax=Nocardiopsis sp. CC223A TaxID=3044051 RepID=UPI00278BF4B3|nr:phosphatidate cytidylyltransferase [Nocardiopsis sp. CC223A]
MTTPSSGSGGDDHSPEHRPDDAQQVGPGDAGADKAAGQRFVLHKPGGEPVKTGRNLPVAIASGCLLGALVFFSVFPWPALFTIITSLGVLIGMRELNRAFASKGMDVAVAPLAVGGVAMQSAAYFGGPEWLLGTTALTAIAALVWRLRGGADGFVADTSASMFTLAYLPFLLATWMLLIAHPEDGQQRLVTFIVVTISSDIGGYFAGILLGRHKMAPVISPNKTWEGFGGSVLGCALAGALCVVLMLDGPWWVGVVLGLAVVLAATVGDLIESLFKRDLGIKDMGRFMPGHGGLMDRLDSLLIAGPVVWIVLSLLLP